MSQVYLNGEYMLLENAKISVLDRGFVFGDGVYEVVPCYGGKAFRLKEHLQRLEASLHGIKLENPLKPHEWAHIFSTLIATETAADLSIYLQITRGVAPRDHAFPTDVSPTVFVMIKPLPPLDAKSLQEGVAAITLDDIRWRYCHLKTIALLPNILLRQQALESGATEAILVREGYLTEGTASNIFVVCQGKILTPPKGPFLLPGITRDLVLELAHSHQIPAFEEPISLAQLNSAEEVWLTSSTKEVLAITRLDGRPVGNATPGPLWDKMYKILQTYKDLLKIKPHSTLGAS